MQNTVCKKWKLIGRKKVANRSILQQLLQDNNHFIGFLIIIFNCKTK